MKKLLVLLIIPAIWIGIYFLWDYSSNILCVGCASGGAQTWWFLTDIFAVVGLISIWCYMDM